METIKNYLEQMFLNMPRTPEVIKAKNELYQMMEDKYYELKQAGKTDNEAIGTVIAEFGNIEEVKEELGLKYQQTVKLEKEINETAKFITLEEAKEYLRQTKESSYKIAIGVMLCIFSPILLLFLGGASEYKNAIISENAAGFFGLLALFIFIMIAVAIFIYDGVKLEKYDYLKKEIFYLDTSAEHSIKKMKEENNGDFTIKLIIGIVLCIFSVIPIFFVGCFYEFNELASALSVCLLFVLVGIAMPLLIPAGMQQESYKVLLQEGEYKKSSKNNVYEVISSVYWCVTTAIYLGWSFWTMEWGYTWIIWPVAGVLFGAVSAICMGLQKKG